MTTYSEGYREKNRHHVKISSVKSLQTSLSLIIHFLLQDRGKKIMYFLNLTCSPFELHIIFWKIASMSLHAAIQGAWRYMTLMTFHNVKDLKQAVLFGYAVWPAQPETLTCTCYGHGQTPVMGLHSPLLYWTLYQCTPPPPHTSSYLGVINKT